MQGKFLPSLVGLALITIVLASPQEPIELLNNENSTSNVAASGSSTSGETFGAFGKAVMGSSASISFTKALSTADQGVLMEGQYGNSQVFITANPSGEIILAGEVTGDTTQTFVDQTVFNGAIVASKTEMVRFDGQVLDQVTLGGAVCENWASAPKGTEVTQNMYFCNSGLTIIALGSTLTKISEVTLDAPGYTLDNFVTGDFSYNNSTEVLTLTGVVGNNFFIFELAPTDLSFKSISVLQFPYYTNIHSHTWVKIPELKMDVLVTMYDTNIGVIGVDMTKGDVVLYEVLTTPNQTKGAAVTALLKGFVFGIGDAIFALNFEPSHNNDQAVTLSLAAGSASIVSVTPCANGANYFFIANASGSPPSVFIPGLFFELSDNFTFPDPSQGSANGPTYDVSSGTASFSPQQGSPSSNPPGPISFTTMTKPTPATASNTITVTPLSKPTIKIIISQTIKMTKSFTSDVPPAKTTFKFQPHQGVSVEYFYINPTQFGGNIGTGDVCQLTDESANGDATTWRYSLVDKFGQSVIKADLTVESKTGGSFKYTCYGLFSGEATVEVV
eukprot:CAMPEP_0114976384 /NCGR_PEP_ID=MMETSP0216-20121206/2641_1 /TAXON_ID=223996 /ORGANISM="Protocruzia adherens, Strain Boccale" /LENGTH=558 /DNA_ID=CAMNT_0002337303 /DNA_START=886 /DNA_END=2562 /DNA_ORIENTATION=-